MKKYKILIFKNKFNIYIYIYIKLQMNHINLIKMLKTPNIIKK